MTGETSSSLDSAARLSALATGAVPAQRIIGATSSNELERRWQAVRSMMAEKRLDYLVLQNSEEFIGGALRWLTDWSARNQLPMTVVFPREEEMTLINCGSEAALPQAFPPPWASRGVKERWGDVYFPSTAYTRHYDAKLAVKALTKTPSPRIGWVEPSFIPMTFAGYLQENLLDATFVDATEEIDRLRARKSDEELAALARTTQLQDACIEHLRSVITAGMHEYDVYAEVQQFTARHGASRAVVLVGSGPVGSFAPFEDYALQGRQVHAGDHLAVLIESNGPGGVYAEILRVFTIDCEPDSSLAQGWSDAVACQHHIAKLLVPGASCREVYEDACQFMISQGYAAPSRSFAHAQGYSFLERPNIRPDEPWDLDKWMILAVHPTVVDPGRTWVTCCDDYLVGESAGAMRLHRSPQEILIV
jgi:Xaa-Pro aminopeptidase